MFACMERLVISEDERAQLLEAAEASEITNHRDAFLIILSLADGTRVRRIARALRRDDAAIIETRQSFEEGRTALKEWMDTASVPGW